MSKDNFFFWFVKGIIKISELGGWLLFYLPIDFLFKAEDIIALYEKVQPSGDTVVADKSKECVKKSLETMG